jgi:hypothetical protein
MNPEDGTSLFFNSLLHSIILFTILSALYILVVVKMIENSFKSQITMSVDKGVNPVLDDFPKETIVYLKLLPLEKLQSLYANPSPEIKVYNDWLTKAVIAIIFGMIIIFIFGMVLLYFTCGQTIPFLHLLIENIAVFSCVGAFEFFFFFYIASKYIPIKPSLLSEIFYTELKNSI